MAHFNFFKMTHEVPFKIGLVHNYSYKELQETELHVNFWIQQNMVYAEPLLEFMSKHINVSFLMDILLPIVACISYPLMVLLASALSLSNVLTSSIKWVMHTSRPYWIYRELENTSLNVTLNSHELVCETTSGFPSSHIAAFTACIYMLAVHSRNNLISIFFNVMLVTSTILMWMSRLYFADQFLHQCFVSGLGTILALQYFDSKPVYLLKRAYSIMIVLGLGLVCILAYLYMLLNDIDPFWSVRMGFKYCPDPSFLKHVTSPIFLLARDFGFVLGVAMSAPIQFRYNSRPTGAKRVLCIAVLELANFLARYWRPTQNGRFIFIASEFIRNILHSLGLLQILSKIY